MAKHSIYLVGAKSSRVCFISVQDKKIWKDKYHTLKCIFSSRGWGMGLRGPYRALHFFSFFFLFEAFISMYYFYNQNS